MKYKKRQEKQRSWYRNKEELNRIKDLYSEINSNMKASDLIDFEKYMMFMLSCDKCSYSMINLSYCTIRFQLVESHKNKFNNVYKIEIIDRYISSGYILQTIKFKKLYHMVHKIVQTMESDTY